MTWAKAVAVEGIATGKITRMAGASQSLFRMFTGKKLSPSDMSASLQNEPVTGPPQILNRDCMSANDIDPQALLEEAISNLESGDLEAAKTTCHELQSAGIIDGWHLLSVIHHAADNLELAVQTLEEGITKFPEDWGLLAEKGHLLANLGQQDEAVAAFEQALPLAGDRQHEVHMLWAQAEFQNSQIDEALNRLQQIKTADNHLEVLVMQLEILDEVGRQDLIIEMLDEELEAVPAPTDEGSFIAMSTVLTRMANAFWEEQDDESQARQMLRMAFHYFRNNEEALWLWREMDPEFSDQPQAYTLEIEGQFLDREDLGEVAGRKYHTSYGVVANDLNDAIAFVQTFEIDAVDKESMQVLEAETEGADTEDALGVYWAGDMVVLDETQTSPNGQG